MLDPVGDKIRLAVLLNCSSILAGIPLSNLYQQHCQKREHRLTLWINISKTIRLESPDVYKALLVVLPCEIKYPIRLVEHMYKAREIVEDFLTGYVSNPQVLNLLGASTEDLVELCDTLITMRPYIANLAHEILKNSNEGIQLKSIGSFTNVQKQRQYLVF